MHGVMINEKSKSKRTTQQEKVKDEEKEKSRVNKTGHGSNDTIDERTIATQTACTA